MRAMIASGIEPSAIAGRIRCWMASHAACPVPRDDPVEDVEVRRVLRVDQDVLSADARQPAEPTAKTYLRISARKKIGIETPISDRNRLAWSSRRAVLFRREEAERDPDETREQHRRERKLDGGREPLLDLRR